MFEKNRSKGGGGGLNLKPDPSFHSFLKVFKATLRATAMVLFSMQMLACSDRHAGAPDEKSSPHAPVDARKEKSSGVFAEMGGVTVCLPWGTFDNLEFEKDPADIAKPGEKAVVKRITAAGFDVVLRTDGNGEKQFRYVRPGESDMRGRGGFGISMSVGADAAPPNGVENLYRARIVEQRYNQPHQRYGKPDSTVYGLQRYIPVGDDSNGVPHRYDRDSEDVYIGTRDGRPTTYIACSNAPVPDPPCHHHFSLDPEFRVSARLSYRKSLLPEWSSLEDVTKKTIRMHRASTCR